MIFVISKTSSRNCKAVFNAVQKIAKATYAANSVTSQNEPKTNNDDSKPENVYLQKETNLKAGIGDVHFSFDLRSTAQTNWQVFRYDYWGWITNFMDRLSHRNEFKETKLKTEESKNDLINARKAKRNIENELEEIRFKLGQSSLEKRIAMSHDSTSRNCLHLVAQENDLKECEHKLIAELKNLRTREENYFHILLLAIEDSNQKEHLHTRFMKSAILFCIVFTLILTSIAAFVHNFNTLTDLKHAHDKIKELTAEKYRKDSITAGSQQSWGPYLKSYVRPLYGWAMPKN